MHGSSRRRLRFLSWVGCVNLLRCLNLLRRLLTSNRCRVVRLYGGNNLIAMQRVRHVIAQCRACLIHMIENKRQHFFKRFVARINTHSIRWTHKRRCFSRGIGSIALGKHIANFLFINTTTLLLLILKQTATRARFKRCCKKKLTLCIGKHG